MKPATAVSQAPTRADIGIHGVLRIASAACFIGHGAFGLITKEAWIPFFAVFGMSRELGYDLMPLIGSVDIALGVWVLLRPNKVVIVYMVGWALLTALLRPLSGASAWEFFERAGNYGVPLTLLLLSPPATTMRDWVKGFGPRPIPNISPDKLLWVLQFTVAFLMIGHGALALFINKQTFIYHMSFVHAFSTDDAFYELVRLLKMGGRIEILLGLLILIRPFSAVVLVAFLWKIGTELLYRISGDFVWEFVERGGSYGAPLALFLVLSKCQQWAGARRFLADDTAPSNWLLRVSRDKSKGDIWQPHLYGSCVPDRVSGNPACTAYPKSCRPRRDNRQARRRELTLGPSPSRQAQSRRSKYLFPAFPDDV